MKSIGHLLLGILTAAGSGLLVLGAISLALVEGGSGRASIPVPPTPSLTIAAILTPAGGVTLQPTPTQAITIALAPTSCKYPDGWVKYTVQNGEDVDTLAARSGLSAQALMQANCLFTTTLQAGWEVSLPFIPTETAAPTLTEVPPTRPPCGPVPGWVLYTVQAGDTLSYLSKVLGVSVWQLQQANCLSGTLIQTGMRLYVPFIPAPRPVATDTPAPLPTESYTPQPTVNGTLTLIPKPGPTETATPEPPTATPETTMPTPETTVVTVAPTQETVAPTTEVLPTQGATAGAEFTATPEPTKEPHK